jgi:hypothetical protein
MIDMTEEDSGTCYLCGGPTYIVRPGHYQCDRCSDAFCRDCGWVHTDITKFCDEYQALLQKYDLDERRLLKSIRE